MLRITLLQFKMTRYYNGIVRSLIHDKKYSILIFNWIIFGQEFPICLLFQTWFYVIVECYNNTININLYSRRIQIKLTMTN